MKSLIVKLVVGIVLFAGSLVGGLAATGRLNHAGTANIPLLADLFPEPPKAEGGADQTSLGQAKGEHEPGDPNAAPTTATAEHKGEPGAAADASQEKDPQEPREQKTGRSVVQPESPRAAGEHGAAAPDAKEPGEKAEGHGKAVAPAKAAPEAAEPEARQSQPALVADADGKYAPGGYFKFEGMPAGLTPEQLNEAWQRVQGVLEGIEHRKIALDLREQSVQELADDVARRQKELGDERTKITDEHRRLDARLRKFEEQVKLVRSDEVSALKRNAQTLSSFEVSKAAELIQDQWKTDRGQDEVLKLFEFMDKDALNKILEALPTPMVQDLLKKRLRVSKEAAPSAPTKK